VYARELVRKETSDLAQKRTLGLYPSKLLEESEVII
jgi:hypothetical protein